MQLWNSQFAETGVSRLPLCIKRSQLRWFAYVSRKLQERFPKQALSAIFVIYICHSIVWSLNLELLPQRLLRCVYIALFRGEKLCFFIVFRCRRIFFKQITKQSFWPENMRCKRTFTEKWDVKKRKNVFKKSKVFFLIIELKF